MIEGMYLSWKCRDCDYGVVTTANKLCFWDGKKYSKECYEKLAETLDLNTIGEIQLSSKKATVKPRRNAFTKGLEPVSFEIHL